MSHRRLFALQHPCLSPSLQHSSELNFSGTWNLTWNQCSMSSDGTLSKAGQIPVPDQFEPAQTFAQSHLDLPNILTSATREAIEGNVTHSYMYKMPAHSHKTNQTTPDKTVHRSSANSVAMTEKMLRSRYTAIMQRLLAWKQTQASKRFARNRRPDPVFNCLESLPMELLQIVLDQLDNVSLTCLQNTNSRFRAVIPPIEAKNLSRCQKWLIMCRFEADMQEYPALVACAFCKVKRPQKDFGLSYTKGLRAGRAKTNTYYGIEILNMMSTIPIKRYCYRHTESSLGWPPAFQKADQVKWVRTLEPTCLHCGSKPASCGQSATKFYYGPTVPRSYCKRPCETCPTADLPTFSRHGPIHFPWFSTDDWGLIWCFGVTLGGKRMMAELGGKKNSVLHEQTHGFLTIFLPQGVTLLRIAKPAYRTRIVTAAQHMLKAGVAYIGQPKPSSPDLRRPNMEAHGAFNTLLQFIGHPSISGSFSFG